MSKDFKVTFKDTLNSHVTEISSTKPVTTEAMLLYKMLIGRRDGLKILSMRVLGRIGKCRLELRFIVL